MTTSMISSNMRKGIYILFGLIALFASCEKSASDLSEGQPIYLSVRVPEMSLTKVPYEGSAPTTSNPLNVDVWASTTSAVFKNDNKNGSAADGHIVAIHTGGHFQSGDPQLLSQAVYPPPVNTGGSGAPVYFVSMYPQNNWGTNDDGTIATYKFSGCEDLMFAKQVQGAYDTDSQGEVVTNSPTLAFEHLLTRFTVRMGIQLGTGENLLDVQNAWGPVTEMKIQAYNKQGGSLEGLNTVTIDLSKGAAFNYADDLTFSYNNGQNSIGSSLSLYSTDTDTQFPSAGGYALTEIKNSNVPEVAYTMCAPVNATDDSHEYVITVTTEKRGEQEVILDLRESDSALFTGDTRGKHFGVTLKFRKGSAIATVAKVEEWENGGYGSGEIED